MPKKGYKHSEETKRKIGLANSVALKGNVPWNKGLKGFQAGEKNNKWKGNKVGYHALHCWVNNHFGKPEVCEHCGKSELTGQKIHWANKSGEYLRERTDWLRLCVPCHRKYDGFAIKMQGNTNGFKKGFTPWNKGKKGIMPIPWNKGKKGVMPIPWNKGKTGVYSEETLKKNSEAHKKSV